MSALSAAGFGFRSNQMPSFGAQNQRGIGAQQGTQRGNSFGQAQQSQRGGNIGQAQQGLQSQRGQGAQQSQRTTTFNSTSSSLGAARSGQNGGGFGSALCPTCNTTGTSYCPTCNTAGGRQTNVGGGYQHTFVSSGQGGQICVSCGYQGR